MSTSLQDVLAKVGKQRLTDEEVRRFRIHHIWPSPDKSKNDLILDALQVIERVAPVIIISEGHILDEYYELPMLEDSDGIRHSGVDSIRKYADSFLPMLVTPDGIYAGADAIRKFAEKERRYFSVDAIRKFFDKLFF